MLIGKSFSFDSSHFLEDHPKCGQIHGHTWTLWVELEGPVDHKTGMVADFQKLTTLVKMKVVDRLDHIMLNEFFDTEDTKHLTSLPTCENLAGWIANELAPSIPEPITKLIITLQEGKGGYAKHELKLR